MALISSQKVVQQIILTHFPDDNYDVDKTALLSMAQDILCNEFSALTPDPITVSNVPKTELDNELRKGITERLAFILHKIGCELSCNCSGRGDIKSITLTLFEKLVRGIVTCSSQSISFMNQQNIISIIEAREKLIAVTETLNNIHEKLKTISEEKKIKEGYYRIQYIIRTTQTDNMKILSELIQTKDGKALFNGATKAEASLDVLKSKTVILFISYLDISEEQVKEVDQQLLVRNKNG
ncbi:hypothetical protein AAC387_Pa02g3765 [Persea americana]